MSNQAKLNGRPFLLETAINSVVILDWLLKKYLNKENIKTSDFSTRALYVVTQLVKEQASGLATLKGITSYSN